MLLNQKEVILGLENRVISLQIGGAIERPTPLSLAKANSYKYESQQPQQVSNTQTPGQQTQNQPGLKQLPTCRFEGKVMDLALLGSEYLVVAEGNIDPASKQVIKIFKGDKLVKEITEPRFRAGFYPYQAICPFNAFGRVFEVAGDRIMFNSHDWKIYSIKMTGANIAVHQELDPKCRLNHFRVVSNPLCLFGITTDRIIKASIDNNNPQVTKCAEMDKALTAIEYGGGYLFVAQHCSMHMFQGDNALIILDSHLKERNKFHVDMRESIRHLKYFSCKGIHYLMVSSFGYDSMLLVYEFTPSDLWLNFCRKITGANQNPMCSWVNHALPLANSGSVLTVGPLGHCVVHRFRLDFN